MHTLVNQSPAVITGQMRQHMVRNVEIEIFKITPLILWYQGLQQLKETTVWKLKLATFSLKNKIKFWSHIYFLQVYMLCIEVVGKRTVPRSYIIETPKGFLVRTKCHLAPLPTDANVQTSPPSMVSKPGPTQAQPESAFKDTKIQTWPGRITMKSKRFTE